MSGRRVYRRNIGKSASIMIGIMVLIFGATGISNLISGIKYLKTNDTKEGYVTITATISDIVSKKTTNGYSHEVYLTYTYDGVTYENKRYNTYSSSMYIGKEIEILCDSEHPDRIQSKLGLKLPTIVMFVIGGTFTLVSIILVIVMIKLLRGPKDIKEKLLKKGLRLKAVIEEIRTETESYVTGGTAYRIICTYTDTNENIIYRFKSDLLLEDPSANYYVGMPIEVVVDSKDYSQYYVNVGFGQTQKVVDFV